jgi:hypothetical protein
MMIDVDTYTVQSGYAMFDASRPLASHLFGGHMVAKECSKCGETKVAADFYKQTKSGDGLMRWCKECCSAYSKARPKENAEKSRRYALKHPELCAKRNREYREAHPEEVAERHRAYRLKNITKELARDARYKAEHADSIRERDLRYQAEHRAEIIERCRAYRLAYPEKTAAKNRQYKVSRPERYAANLAVGNAIKHGHLVSQPCFICGNKGEAHHASYAPEMLLIVTWVCRVHHRQIHREAKTALVNEVPLTGKEAL